MCAVKLLQDLFAIVSQRKKLQSLWIKHFGRPVKFIEQVDVFDFDGAPLQQNLGIAFQERVDRSELLLAQFGQIPIGKNGNASFESVINKVSYSLGLD